MKKILSIAFVIIISVCATAQIKIDTKKLAKAKEMLNTVTNEDNKKQNSPSSGNTVINPAVENKTTGTTNTSSNPALAANVKKNNTAGWSMDDLDNISTTNAYFGSGWTLDKFSPRTTYNSTLTIPVVEAFYWNYCFKQPFRMRVFNFSDKDALVKYDFEAEAAAEHQKGRYRQEMIITEKNKFIIILSYYEKVEPELDNYMAEKIPDLKHRLPSGYW